MSAIANAWNALTGFLTHHIADLESVAHALSSINAALPIDSQDKEHISAAIEVVEQSAANISAWLAGAPKQGSDVVIKESDLRNAIAGFLSSDEGKDYVRSLISGNSNA